MEVPDWLHPRVAEQIGIETDGAIARAGWGMTYKLIPFRDGDVWCVLLGEDLQSGIAGFGETPEKAMNAFDFAFRNEPALSKEPTP